MKSPIVISIDTNRLTKTSKIKNDYLMFYQRNERRGKGKERTWIAGRALYGAIKSASTSSCLKGLAETCRESTASTRVGSG